MLCDTAIVQIDILPEGNPTENNPPTAVDDALSTGQDTPVNGDLSSNDFDVDGDDITFTVIGGNNTPNGTISNFDPATGTFTYTPDSGFEGDDQFEYYICDNGTPVLCDTAVVVINNAK